MLEKKRIVQSIEKCFREMEAGEKDSVQEGDGEGKCAQCPIRRECQEYARSGKISKKERK